MANLTTLGVIHTLISLIPVIAGPYAIIRHGSISSRNRAGQFYLLAVIATLATGMPIFRKGVLTPPHFLGFATIAALAVAFMAERRILFGRRSSLVETLAYSFTLLLSCIPLVTETLTRLPASSPVAATQEAPIVLALNGLLMIGYVALAVVQVRALRRGAAA